MDPRIIFLLGCFFTFIEGNCCSNPIPPRSVDGVPSVPRWQTHTRPAPTRVAATVPQQIGYQHSFSYNFPNQPIYQSAYQPYPVIILRSEDLCPKKREEEIEERNKKIVLQFLQQCFGDKDVGAIDRYIGTRYVQHNPTVGDGKAEFRKAAGNWFKDAPKESLDVRRVAADGDLVWVHWRSVEGLEVQAVVDIFRLENGLIVEHWDVNQSVPKQSMNENTMF